MKIKPFSLILLVLPISGQASSFFIGLQATETTLYLGEKSTTLRPLGPTIALNYDLDDNWSVNLDYAQLDKDEQIEDPVYVDFTSDSRGMGVSYYADRWSTYYQFSDYKDQQLTNDSGPAPLSKSATDSYTHSLGASYYWQVTDHWQISNAIGLHYSDWQQDLVEQPDESDRPAMTILTPGNATLLSASISANRLLNLSSHADVNIGFYASWNEVISDNSDVQDGENDPRRQPHRDRDQNRNNFVASGSQSYGLFSAYVALDFAQNWTVDLDTTVDFGSDDSNQTWRFSVGYRF